MLDSPSELMKLLWSVASVILGFQITAFIFRLQRETSIRRWQERHFPACEYLNLASIALFVVGVFVLPLVGAGTAPRVKGTFAAAIILFAFYPIAAAAHYKFLFRSKASGNSDTFCSPSELAVLLVAILAAIVGFCFTLHA